MLPDGKELSTPLKIEVSKATTRAIDAIKERGGTVTCVYRTKLTLTHHVKPHKFDKAPADPQPSPSQLLRLEKLKDKGLK